MDGKSHLTCWSDWRLLSIPRFPLTRQIKSMSSFKVLNQSHLTYFEVRLISFLTFSYYPCLTEYWLFSLQFSQCYWQRFGPQSWKWLSVSVFCRTMIKWPLHQQTMRWTWPQVHLYDEDTSIATRYSDVLALVCFFTSLAAESNQTVGTSRFHQC